MNAHPHLVILAGGMSSRMGSPIPKSMIRVGPKQRPFLEFLLRNAALAGYTQTVLVIGPTDRSIPDHFKDGHPDFPSLRISLVVQPVPEGSSKPPGSADALHRALLAMPEWKGTSLTVCNSDNLYSVEAFRWLLLDDHDNAMIDYDRAALQFTPERIAAFAVIRKDAEGYLTDILEKPALKDLESAADSSGRIGVSMNIFRFSCDRILPFLESLPLHPLRREKELPAAVQAMITAHPRSMMTIPRAEHVPDLTGPADVEIVSEYLRSRS